MDCAQCQRNDCGVHWRPRTAWNGGQIQSISQISLWTCTEEHYVVEALLGHGRSQVGFDASEGGKGPFPSCCGNRDCEIDPRSPACLPRSLNKPQTMAAVQRQACLLGCEPWPGDFAFGDNVS